MFTEFVPLSVYNSSLLHTRLKIYHRMNISRKQHGGHNFIPVPTWSANIRPFQKESVYSGSINLDNQRYHKSDFCKSFRTGS
jgi:hypothetical protein